MRRIVSAGAVVVFVLVIVGVAVFLYATPSPDVPIIDTAPPPISQYWVAGNTTSLRAIPAPPVATDRVKLYVPKTKTITIKDKANADLMTVRLISSMPDLCTFTEVFEVTNLKAFMPATESDYKARTVKHVGKKDVRAVEWFIEQNVSYTVNITDYKVVKVEKEVYNNKTGKNETILVNETIITGYHDETRYKNVWQDYEPHGKPVSDNSVQRIKVVYHKPPELGEVNIQTIPMFRGVECGELTWWNTSWNHRRNLTIDHNMVDAALSNFPVMVSLTQTGLNTLATDLRIMDSSDNPVAREIECYNAASGELVFFFNGATISNAADTSFWMYYNNPAATEPAADSTYGSENVWDSGYVGVWHMNNDPSGAGAQLKDSTSNDNGGTSYGSMTSGDLIDGTYGKGIDFDGSDDYFRVAYSAELALSAWTIESNMKSTNYAAGFQAIVSRGHHFDDYRNYQLLISIPAAFGAVYENTAGTDAIVTGGGTFTNDVVYNIAYTYTNPITRTYQDGVQADADTQSITPKTAQTSFLTIGEYVKACGTAYTWEFLGQMYEVRVSNNERSANHISTTHNNLNNPTATGTAPFFASFGAAEDIFIITSYAPATPLNKNEGDSQTFNITVSPSCQCRWYIDGALVETDSTPASEHTYINASLVVGDNQNFSAVANITGVSDMQTWVVNVSTSATYIPPEPVLSYTSGGDFWVNYTWTAGAGNDTDAWNVSYNGVWDNGTTTAFRNETVSGGGWHNITVCAWNTSGVGTLSATCASDSIIAPTYKPPEPTGIGHTTGNFWVHHTWIAGGGNVTDSYRVLVNGAWHNTSNAYHNGTGYAPHGWQNISVWAWNSTAQGTISD